MKKIFLCAFGLACMAVACNSVKEDAPAQYGEISVTLGEPDIEVVTKAAEELKPTDTEAANYTVRIFNSSDEKQYEVKYSEFTSPYKLELGTYYVTAENCTEAAAESENVMRLYGRSDNITLTADAISKKATVNCEVANSLVSVVFDQSVSGQFDDLKVELTGTKTVTVAETAADVETKTWFNPQTISYKISGTFKQLNKYIELPSVQRTLEAKNYVKIVVKLNTSNGQLLPEITVNTDIQDPTEVSGEFNPYE